VHSGQPLPDAHSHCDLEQTQPRGSYAVEAPSKDHTYASPSLPSQKDVSGDHTYATATDKNETSNDNGESSEAPAEVTNGLAAEGDDDNDDDEEAEDSEPEEVLSLKDIVDSVQNSTSTLIPSSV